MLRSIGALAQHAYLSPTPTDIDHKLLRAGHHQNNHRHFQRNYALFAVTHIYIALIKSVSTRIPNNYHAREAHTYYAIYAIYASE